MFIFGLNIPTLYKKTLPRARERQNTPARRAPTLFNILFTLTDIIKFFIFKGYLQIPDFSSYKEHPVTPEFQHETGTITAAPRFL
jgi:hypothetical protein